ncbi:hypothetical protein EMIT0P43_170013 [Pseudomonas jessenii]
MFRQAARCQCLAQEIGQFRTMVRPADGGDRCHAVWRNRRGITCGQCALAVTYEVDFVCTGSFQYPLDLCEQLVSAYLVVMDGRQVGNEHPGSGVPQRLPDVVKELELADSFEAEKAVDQQYWVTSACIPLHVHTFTQKFIETAWRFTLKHSRLARCMKSPAKLAENGIEQVRIPTSG